MFKIYKWRQERPPFWGPFPAALVHFLRRVCSKFSHSSPMSMSPELSCCCAQNISWLSCWQQSWVSTFASALCIYIYVYLSIDLSIYLPIHLSIFLSIYLQISTYIYVYMYTYIHIKRHKLEEQRGNLKSGGLFVFNVCLMIMVLCV